MSNKELSGQIAGACFVIIFVSMIFMGVYAVGYKNGVKAALVENETPIYRMGQMPTEKPAFAIYEGGGIITMVTAFRMNDGRILPHNIYGGLVPYDILDDPIGWTPIPEGLMEIMK